MNSLWSGVTITYIMDPAGHKIGVAMSNWAALLPQSPRFCYLITVFRVANPTSRGNNSGPALGKFQFTRVPSDGHDSKKGKTLVVKSILAELVPSSASLISVTKEVG